MHEADVRLKAESSFICLRAKLKAQRLRVSIILE